MDTILGMSRLSSKHQITIPKDAITRFEFKAGDRVIFKEKDGRLILEKGQLAHTTKEFDS